MDVSQLRSPYNNEVFTEKDVLSDPFSQFETWFKYALENDVSEPNGMCLSTCTCDGKPSSRYVLMKSFSKNGFLFYSNYDSRKGRELAKNPNASILFYWQAIHRQVRIEGTVSKVSSEDSLQYFKTRSKTSQASAFISKQSQIVSSRSELESKLKDCLDQHSDTEVPKPANWGGYLFQPFYFEFWQGHTSRLHDRIVFTKDQSNGERWNIIRLYP